MSRPSASFLSLPKMSRASAVATLLVAALTLTVFVTLPVQARPAALEAPSLDQELLTLNRAVPGFGGMYVDGDGVVNVWMRDPAAAPTETLERWFGAAVRVRHGDWEFAQIAAWRDAGRTLLTTAGVVLIDADEQLNRVRVGVAPGAGAGVVEAVRAEMARRGVPADAVVIREVPEVRPMVTLSDPFHPVPGGVEIHFSNFLCTLGFNVRFADDGPCYFLTNDHCTDVQGAVDGTVYFQPFGGPRIGVEVADPPFFSGGACPAGRVCRYSDAAGARYDDPADCEFGSIARTLLNSTTIDAAQPRWDIVSKQLSPAVGQRMGKVGRTTGWTVGEVIATCVDTNVSGTNQTILCQSFVAAGVGSGDSGAPVFRFRESTSLAQLSGILWGGSGSSQYVFSPMENIEFEFGLALPVF